MTKNINMSKEDAGHDNGCQEEKKEGLITLFLRNWPSWLFMLFHMCGRHFEWFSKGSWENN